MDPVMHTPEISMTELEQLIESGPLVLIDVREPHEVALGMIPSAKHVPLGEVTKALEMKGSEFEAKYGFPKPKKSQKNIVLYCRSGVRSEEATHLFLHKGFKATRNFKGSWVEWHHHHRS